MKKTKTPTTPIRKKREGREEGRKSESSESKSTNGKAEHKEKESAKSSSSSTESKSKATTTKHESEKPKGEKVRLAMLTLKDSLPETSEQAGPFGENKLDMREVMSRLEKAAKDKTVSGLILDIQKPDDRPRQGRRAARRDSAASARAARKCTPCSIRPSRRIISSLARAMKS